MVERRAKNNITRGSSLSLNSAEPISTISEGEREGRQQCNLRFNKPRIDFP
jgi:hypothetical protein